MLDMAAVMTGIADAVRDDDHVAYDFPTAKPSIPSFIVGYPDDAIELDAAMGLGGSRVDFPAWWVVGRRDERGIRDGLSDEIQFIRSAINADPTLGGAAQTVRTTSARIEAVAIGGVEYVAVRFSILVYA